MFQVGQVLNLAGTLTSGDDPYAWVWEFWDGDSNATAAPYYQKTLNRGGTLQFSVTAVGRDGQADKVTNQIVVNSPPEIQFVGLSANDQPAPYNTTLTVVMEDPEDAGNIDVFFDTLSTSISSPGTATFPYAVTEDRVLTLAGTDADGGITSIDIELRTAPAPGLFVTGSAVPPIQRIGPEQTVVIGALASEQNNAPILYFEWELTLANGWASAHLWTSGISSRATGVTAVGGGGYEASVEAPVDGELPGSKIVLLRAFTATASKEINVPVVLIPNEAPVIESFVYPGTIVPGEEIEIAVVAEDPEEDALSYRWWFTSPTVEIIGNPAAITAAITSAFPTGTFFAGTITITDSLGEQVTQALPFILVTSDLTATAVKDVAFSYAIEAAGETPITFSVDNLPPGLALGVDGSHIVGTPTLSGSVDVEITATNFTGSHVSTLRIDILPTAPAPPPTTNLLVNGSDTPTYISGQDLLITWEVSNDIETLPTPSTELELRNTVGSVLGTILVAAGTTTYTLTNFELQATYSGQPNVVIRAYTKRSGTRSQLYQELVVIRV